MFKKIIEDLIQTDMTEKEIGDAVGASQATINRIRNGKQRPYYDLGVALTTLHAEKITSKKAA